MTTADTPRTDAVMASKNWPWHITKAMKDVERDLSLMIQRYELLKEWYECKEQELTASKAEVERLREEAKSLNEILEQLQNLCTSQQMHRNCKMTNTSTNDQKH